jgi:hypothetical protein
MDAGVVVAVVLGVPTLLTSTYFGSRSIASTTKADKEKAAAAVQARIDKAVKEANDACQVRLTAKDERITELTSDRDAERDRANALQASINDRGLGPIR